MLEQLDLAGDDELQGTPRGGGAARDDLRYRVPLVRARTFYGLAALHNGAVSAVGLGLLLLVSEERAELLGSAVLVALGLGALFSSILVVTRVGRPPSVAPAPAAAQALTPGQTSRRLWPTTAGLAALVVVLAAVPGGDGESLVAGLPGAAALVFAVMAGWAKRWEHCNRATLLLAPVHHRRAAWYVVSPLPNDVARS